MTDSTPLPLGGQLKNYFPFDKDWTNLNNGSFGSIPNAIVERLRHYQTQYEARPDGFIRFDRPKLINESREALAQLVNTDPDTVVLVGNTTEGVNTILRNIEWKDNDVILTFSTGYFGVVHAAEFISDYFDKVEHRVTHLDYPLEDDDILPLFKKTVESVKTEGKTPRIAIIDTVSSLPGVVFPWKQMVEFCKAENILSLVDGAHSVGMLHLDLAAVDPDFFVSNCHKWLHVPRGCALFYVPLRNQHLIPSSHATSLGFNSKHATVKIRASPMAVPDDSGNDFTYNFGFVGTKDDAPYMCVKDAIAWRKHVLGGEDRIMNYMRDLNKKGSQRVADVLGTEVLENKKGTLTDSPLGTIRLPLHVGEDVHGEVCVAANDWKTIVRWMERTMVEEYKTFIPHVKMGSKVYVRISAQVYLDLEDYQFAGNTLKEICERIGKKEYLQ